MFDGSGENAFDADAVAAHDWRDLLAVGIEHARTHRLGVFVAKLEDVADFDGLANYQLAAAVVLRACFAFVDAADVSRNCPFEVAAGHYVAQVVIELVGASYEVLAALERLVDNDREPFS